MRPWFTSVNSATRLACPISIIVRARATLQRVVRLQPANPESWLRLGQFELEAGRARRALRLLGAAIYLDPRGPEAQTAYAQAQQAVAQAQATRAR